MKAEHTQDGPWVDAGLTGPDPRIVGGPLRLVKCNGVVIAFLPAWLDDEHEEARANARLIAAAPDLLKELERQIEWAWNPFEPKNQSDQYKRMKALFDRVTGESHE